MRNNFLVTLSFLLILSMCSCFQLTETNSFDASAQTSNINSPSNEQSRKETDNISQQKSAAFKGVSFVSRLLGVSTVETVEIPAAPLTDESAKPDNVHPAYLSFAFKGDYAERRNSSAFSPKIEVYPIEEYRRALAKSPSETARFDKELGLLKNLLKGANPNSEKIPFVPFIDAETVVTAQLKRISFKNGRGLRYLTQFNVEPTIINNQGLTYIFQGLTNDEKFYVLAAFPVSTAELPVDADANNTESYKIPDDFYNPKNSKTNEKNYRKYASRVKAMLEKLTPNEFEPKITQLDETLSSLECTDVRK